MKNQPIQLYAALLVGVAALAGVPGVGVGQVAWPYAVNAPPVAAADPEQVLLAPEQLDQLLGPVALYPDPLLAQVLPAASYVQEVLQAGPWVDSYPQADDRDIDAQPWDPSVKALAHYPTVLKMMCQNPDWTQALGAAFVNQPDDVMAAVQRLRQLAAQAGNLTPTPQQQVIVDGSYVQILPADPEIIYVPVYDVRYVYVRGPSRYQILFPHRHRVGIWLTNSFDWGHNWLTVGVGWHYGWDYGRDRRWVRVNPPVIYSRDRRPIEPIRWTHNRAKPLPVLPVSLRRPATPLHRTEADLHARGFDKPLGTINRPINPGLRIPSGHTGKDVSGHAVKDTPVYVKPITPSRVDLRKPAAVSTNPLGLPAYQNPKDTRHIVDRGERSLQTHVTPPVAVDKTPVKVIDRTPVKVGEKTPVKAIERTPVKVIEKTPVKAIERTPVKVVEKTPVKVIERTPVKVVEKTPVKVIDKTPALTRKTPPAVLEEIAPAKETKVESERGHKSLRR